MGSKHSKTTPPPSDTDNMHWQVAFTSKYEIHLSQNLSKHARKSLYTNVKIDLKRMFNELHATDPEFKNVRIRFNDENQSIKIGYDYKDFQKYINNYTWKKGSKFSWFLPCGQKIDSNNGQISYRNGSFEVSSDFTLLASDGTPLAVMRNHKNYNSEVANSLKERAERHFDLLPSVDSTKLTIVSNIIELFKQQKETIRLAIGEEHHQPDAMQMLMEAVKGRLFPKGTTIALEHLIYDMHQNAVDRWLKSPPETPISHVLDELLGYHYDGMMQELLIEAKAQGLHILSLDSSDLKFLPSLSSRIEGMNYFAKKVIDHHVGEGPLVIVAGSAHIGDITFTKNGKTQTILGLGSLLDNMTTLAVHKTDQRFPLSHKHLIIPFHDDFDLTTLAVDTVIHPGIQAFSYEYSTISEANTHLLHKKMRGEGEDKTNTFTVPSNLTLEAKDGTLIALDYGHKDFWAEVEKSLAQRGKSFENLPPDSSTKETLIRDFKELFKKQPDNTGLRLVIGEYSKVWDGRELLLQAIKNGDIPENTTVALEELYYDKHQVAIDEWLASPDAKLPLVLRNFLKDHLFLKEILEAAKHRKLHVLAISTEATSNIPPESDVSTPFDQRIKAKNYIAKKLIQHRVKDGEPIVVLMDAYSAADKTTTSHGETKTLLGLGSLLDSVKTMLVLDTDQPSDVCFNSAINSFMNPDKSSTSLKADIIVKALPIVSTDFPHFHITASGAHLFHKQERKKAGDKKSSSDDSINTALVAEDGTLITFDYGHKDFWTEVEKTLNEQPKTRFEGRLPEGLTSKNIIGAFKTLFRQQQNKELLRLSIGEEHSNPGAREMLLEAIQNGDIPKGTTIALEGLFYNKHQEALTQWLASEDADFPPTLKRYLEFKPDVKKLLRAAKEKGLFILAIDTEALCTDLFHDSSASEISNYQKRLQAMNAVAKKLIEKHVGDGSVVLLTGGGHTADTTITHGAKAEKIPGLGSLLNNMATVLVVDTKQSSDVALDQVIVTPADEYLTRMEAHAVVKVQPTSEESSNSLYSETLSKTEALAIHEKIVLKQLGFLLDKDGKPFTLNYNHKDFGEKAETTLDARGTRFEGRLPEELAPENVIGAFKTIFQNQQNKELLRLVIGEYHTEFPGKDKKSLKYNLDARKILLEAIQNGDIPKGATLVLDELNYNKHQEALDQWLASKDADFHPTLKRFLNSKDFYKDAIDAINQGRSSEIKPSLDPSFIDFLKEKFALENRPSLKEILKAAKEKDLLILAIGTDASSTKDMRHIPKEIIQHRVGDGSFVALVDMTEAVETIITRGGETEKIPGWGSLLDNVATVLVADTTQSSDVLVNQVLLQYSDKKVTSITANAIIKSYAGEYKTVSEAKSSNTHENARVAQQATLQKQALKTNTQAAQQNSDTTKSESSVQKSTPPRETEIHTEKGETSGGPSDTRRPLEAAPPDNNGPDHQRSKGYKRLSLDTGLSSDGHTPKTGAAFQNTQHNAAPKPIKHPYKNTVISGGMVIFGGAGAINSFRKGDIFNGVVGAAEAALGAAGTAASLLVAKSQFVFNILAATTSDAAKLMTHLVGTKSPAALKILAHTPHATLKAAHQTIKGAGHFLKVVPFVGAGFSAIAAYQDANELIEASKARDTKGMVKSIVNLVLDISMGVADCVPGVGTAASFSLLATRLTAGLMIDQMCDREAYQKTWDSIQDPSSNWFDKTVAAVGGSVQLVWSYTPLGMITSAIVTHYQEKEYVQKIKLELEKLKILDLDTLEHIVKVPEDVTEGTRVLDFTGLNAYKNGGHLTVKIGARGEKAAITVSEKNLSKEIVLGTNKIETVYIKMGHGADFYYGNIYKAGEWIPGDIRGWPTSRVSHYHAPDDGTNVVFIASPTPKKGLLPSFKASDFHYNLYGGKGVNIYKLGHQEATIHCGSGINTIEVPFDAEVGQRTISIKNFRHDGSCFLTLKGIQVNADLFQNAKIGVDKTSSLFLKFGATKIDLGTITIDFGETDTKTLYLKTDDGDFDIDIQRLVKHYVLGTEKSFKDHISSARISHMDDTLKVKDKNIVSLKEDAGETIIFDKDESQDGNYSLSLRHISSDSERFKNAKFSFSPNTGDLNLSFGNRVIKFKYSNVKHLSILTDDRLSFVDIESARKQGMTSDALPVGPNFRTPGPYISSMNPKPSVSHAEEKVWRTFDLSEKTFSSTARCDTLFRATSGKDAFIFDAKKIGKAVLKDFSIEGGDTVQITNCDNLSDLLKNSVEEGTDLILTFDALNELRVLNTKCSELEQLVRKPTLYGLVGEKDAFILDAKKIGQTVIKNFSLKDEDALHIRNIAETKESLLGKTSQKGKDVVIIFDAFNEVTLENLQLSELKAQTYDYLNLDIAA